MSNFQQKDNTARVWPNDKMREGKRDCHFQGRGMINGQEMYVNIWLNPPKDADMSIVWDAMKYLKDMGVSFSEVQSRDTRQNYTQAQGSGGYRGRGQAQQMPRERPQDYTRTDDRRDSHDERNPPSARDDRDYDRGRDFNLDPEDERPF